MAALILPFFSMAKIMVFCLRARAHGAHVLMVPDARIVHVSAGSTFAPTLQRVLFLGARAELFRRTLPEKQIDRAIWVLKLGDWLRKQLSIKSDTDWAYVWNTRSVWSIAPPHLSKLPPKKMDS